MHAPHREKESRVMTNVTMVITMRVLCCSKATWDTNTTLSCKWEKTGTDRQHCMGYTLKTYQSDSCYWMKTNN